MSGAQNDEAPVPTVPEIKLVPDDSGSPASAHRGSAASEGTQTHKSAEMSPKEARKSQSKRASRACLACRQRRVRCNVVEESPCSNCRFRGVECVVKKRTQKKQVSPGFRARDESDKTTITEDAGSPSSSICSKSDVQWTSSIRLGGVESYAKEIDIATLLPEDGVFSYGLGNGAKPTINSSRPQGAISSSEPINLPAFIRPLSRRISPEDLEYLQQKKVFDVPSQSLMNSLLHSFVEYVYPYMPIIDPGDLIDTTFQLKAGKISLLLFQAVMFAGAAYVDLGLLRSAGFDSRKEARRILFRRTRLLYDFDCESEPLVQLQALLLMTYWHDGLDDEKDLSHWIGLAVSLSRSMDLHYQPTPASTPDQLLRKRIWWSCYIRDRQIALGLRRPPKIKEGTFEVPILEESDFDVEISTTSIMIMEDESSSLLDSEMRRDLANMCIAMAKLCVCVGRILETIYTPQFRSSTAPGANGVLLYPNPKATSATVETLDIELDEWIQSLPPCCRGHTSVLTDVKRGRSNIAVQRTLLFMIYYTSISTLHRPQCQSPNNSLAARSGNRERSRLKVLDAAIHIADMATELHHLSLKRFLPPAGVTAILPAMIIHLIEMKNPAPGARALAGKYFRECMNVLVDLQGTYNAGDDAFAILRAALGETSSYTGPQPGAGSAAAPESLTSPQVSADGEVTSEGVSPLACATSSNAASSPVAHQGRPTPLCGDAMLDFALDDQFINDAMHEFLQYDDDSHGVDHAEADEEMDMDEIF